MAKKHVSATPTTRGGGLIEQHGRRQKKLATFQQIALSCRHLCEHLQIDTREDLAGRTLDYFIDNYAKMHFGGTSGVHSINQVHRDYWSEDAKASDQVKKQVEHGTPRPHIRRLIMDLYCCGKLTEDALKQVVERYYVLAVVTADEHRRLDNKTVFRDPFVRWTKGCVTFSTDLAAKHWPNVP